MNMQRIIATVAATTTFGLYVHYFVKTTDWRGVASAVCDHLSEEPVICSDLAKDAFTSTELNTCPNTPGHTHGTAAALRSSATKFSRRMAAFAGAGLYIIGMSRADQRHGLRGTRSWYWTKDVNARVRNDHSMCNDIRYLCDVDYYVDMPALLGKEAKPTLLYTVVPETATSNGEDDTTFFFDYTGALTTLIAGSGHYKHHLWDYAVDSLIATHRTYFGFPTAVTVYAVERKQVSKHRQLILLTPMRKFNGWNAWLAFFLLEGTHLARFLPIKFMKDFSMFIRFNVHRNNETFVTTARPGSFLSATVPAHTDEALAVVARLGTTNLQLPTTVSWVGKDNREASAVLTEYHRIGELCYHRPVTVFPVEQAVRVYHYDIDNHNQDKRAKLQAFMSPLVHSAFSPAMGAEAEQQCVRGRIDKFKREEPRGHDFRDLCMIDFADEIMRGVTHLSPVCVETVELKQTKAGQKQSLIRAFLSGPFILRILKCFIKAEAYPDVKDPRAISSYNDVDKLTMSQFALALSKHLKKFKWYGPGKTPKAIAERMAELCSEADEFVNLSDYHRMDGTITYTLRCVDHIVMKKAFPDHCSEVNELLKTNADNNGKFPDGTKFSQGPAHGSGCAATSVFQTLRAAFCSYFAYRNTIRANGVRYTSAQAIDALGLHNGDDGIDPDLPVANHQWAARKLGLILEAAVVPYGERGVNFLARYYSPNVWYGAPDSMCDIKRQLSKFHTTVRLPDNVKAEDKLVEKAMSYVATDAHTPIIGPLCQLAVSFQPNLKPIHGLGNWWSKFDLSDQYPNANVDGWMDSDIDHMFPEFDRKQFSDWMASVRSLSEMLKAPLCCEIKPATPSSVDVIVDGDLVPKAEEPKQSAAVFSDTASSEASFGKRKRVRTRNRAKLTKQRSIASTRAAGSKGGTDSPSKHKHAQPRRNTDRRDMQKN